MTLVQPQAARFHRQILALLKPFVGRLALGLLVMSIGIVLQLAIPLAISTFVDNAQLRADPNHLTQAVLAMLGVLVIYCAVNALRYYLFESTGYMLVTQLRKRLFESIVGQEIGFFDRHKVGELSSRLSTDVDALRYTLTMQVAIALRSLLICLGGGAMLVMLSPTLSALLLALLPGSILLAKAFGKKVRRKSKAVQKRIAQAVHVAQEHLTNIRVVRSFNQETSANQAYGGASNSILKETLDNTRLFAMFQGVTTLFGYTSLLAILWLGSRQISQSTMTAGELTSFVLYAGMVAMSVNALSGFWGDWMRTQGATERVFELIDRGQKTVAVRNPRVVRKVGEIAFEQVSFAYPSRPEQITLESIELKISVGEKIALLGPSGAGKSTITNLILGFYQPISGSLSFDGISSTRVDFEKIRQRIAIVAQEPALFSTSIADNIAYALGGVDVAQQDIEAAADLANAHEFISGFPAGYQTLVGDRGVQLSGGQKQRIAIARAVLRDPEILILDEATSALDSENEQQVQKALENLMRDRTTLMISHRFSTIAQADRLVVMDQGKIMQIGNHRELRTEQGGLYQRLMAKQASA